MGINTNSNQYLQPQTLRVKHHKEFSFKRSSLAEIYSKIGIHLKV